MLATVLTHQESADKLVIRTVSDPMMGWLLAVLAESLEVEKMHDLSGALGEERLERRRMRRVKVLRDLLEPAHEVSSRLTPLRAVPIILGKKIHYS